MIITLTGKCSTFGGPLDSGMGLTEGLGLIEQVDRNDLYFDRLFLPQRGGLGLGRALNPQEFYCAMRWNEVFNLPEAQARAIAREAMVRVTFKGKSVWLQPCDYGPGDGKVVDGAKDPDTDRLIDCSPQGLKRIGATTDDEVKAEVFA